jgi:hypothetical protein
LNKTDNAPFLGAMQRPLSQPFTEILDAPGWRARQDAHETRVRAWTDAHQARAARGEKHPVYDFLFEYYAFRPSWLRRWHPGVGVGLRGEEAKAFLRWPEYAEDSESGIVAVEPERWPDHRRATVRWLRSLLEAMQTRPAYFGCFGLHEWAMVYQQKHDDLRHARWPLRFPPEEIARIVEAQPLTCTHYDAFRFFTPPARPRNRLALARETAVQHEQRGCLHANMDLYKWAFKLAPFTPSELIADAFALAYDIRAIDMRASPYDFRALGFEPIAIETPAGRAEYEAAQREFSRRGEPLREKLLGICKSLTSSLATF